MREGAFLSNTRKRLLRWYLLSWVFVWVLDRFLTPGMRTMGIGSFLYSFLIMIWLVSMRTRVTAPRIRRALSFGAALFLLLFLLRILRWDIFPDGSFFGRLSWYAYYIPFTFSALCSLSAALSVDRPAAWRSGAEIRVLWVLGGLLSVLALTNDLHGLMFRFDASDRNTDSYAYGPLYYLTVLFIAAVTLAAFFVLLRRCLLSMSRRRWYVPVLVSAGFLILILLYYAAGGAPALFGIRLYNLQEVYALLYLLFWESCIGIGLIPSNADHAQIFSNSALDACIADESGAAVYRAKNAGELPPETVKQAVEAPVLLTEQKRLNGARLENGYVVWREDLSALQDLKRRLYDATERLSEENTLLRLEHETRQKKERIAVKNRLYDETAQAVRPKLEKIRAVLSETAEEPGEMPKKAADITAEPPSRAALSHAALLGAYVKRRVNLLLLSEEQTALSSDELYYSIRESLSYLTLSGAAGDVSRTGEGRYPAAVLLSFYENFEEAAEALPAGGSLLVSIHAGAVLRMTVMTDGGVNLTFTYDPKEAAA